jgi:predicted RNA binding protein YcfA (HicA-like mRNA interferase family)
MAKTPKLNGKEIIKVLDKLGFNVVRIRGSHHILKHRDGRMTVVPVHSNEIIGMGLLSKILNDCEIKKEDFIKLLN